MLCHLTFFLPKSLLVMSKQKTKTNTTDKFRKFALNNEQSNTVKGGRTHFQAQIAGAYDDAISEQLACMESASSNDEDGGN